MPRSLPTVLVAATFLAGAAWLPTAATAHQLSVLRPGDAQLDLGTGAPGRLVHATLEQPGDVVGVTVRAGEQPLDIVLLVPDTPPEAEARPAELPRLRGVSMSAIAAGPNLVDESTGASYRTVAEGQVAPSRGVEHRLEILRGTEPTRVALLVGPPDAPFAATDLQRTPRTLFALRTWQDSPARGADVPPTRAPEGSAPLAWYAAALALIAVLTAVWWIRSGLLRARARGVERELEELRELEEPQRR